MRKDNTVCDLSITKTRLDQISSQYNIKDISIYGGDFQLLPKSYQKDIIELCSCYTKTLSIVSGITRNTLNLIERHDIGLLVSLNSERKDYQSTLNKLKQINSDKITLGVVCTPSVLETSIESLISFYNQLKYPVYLFQYHSSIYNTCFSITNKQYTKWMIEFVSCYTRYEQNFELVNLTDWKSNKHGLESQYIFINPYGQYQSVQYSKNGLESFVNFDSLLEWQEWSKRQDKRKLQLCGAKDCYADCLAEHNYDLTNEYCCGLRKLIQMKLF